MVSFNVLTFGEVKGYDLGMQLGGIRVVSGNCAGELKSTSGRIS